MLIAEYAGETVFPSRRWSPAVTWRCVASWGSKEAMWPATLELTLISPVGPRLEQVRLAYVEPFLGSPALFESDWLPDCAIWLRSASVRISLRLKECNGARLRLAGSWSERGRSTEWENGFELDGQLQRTGEAQAAKASPAAEVRCNVQHLALDLEPLLEELADKKTLAPGKSQQLRSLVQQYWDGSCGTQSCLPVNCAFRRAQPWLQHDLRYENIRDVLHFDKSGIYSDPPTLLRRPGTEALSVVRKRLPGNPGTRR